MDQVRVQHVCQHGRQHGEQESVRMVGISAVKDLLTAGGTFSLGNVQRLQARNGDKQFR
jgi:hypothetical protein